MLRTLIVLITLLTSAAQAQTVTVRAGEHEEFTRVVLQIPAQMDWELGRTADGYGLRLSDTVEFETSSFFTLIPKDRILDVSVKEGGAQLNFVLNCACFAQAFVTDTRWLVIDFGVGLADSTSPYEQAIDDSLDLPEVSFSALPDPPVVQETSAPPSEALLPLIVDRPQTREPLADSVFEKQAEQSDRLAQLEEAVSLSLERALSQGLLESSDINDGLTDAGELSDLDELLEDVARLRGPGVAARTSLDEGLGEDAQNLSTSTDEHLCPRPEVAAVGLWGNEDPFPRQLAELRNGLLGEFDRPDPEAIEKLAQFYVHFAFGREALSAMRIDDAQSSARQVLVSLAQIVDGDLVTDEKFIENMQCEGPLQFWGMLAHTEGPIPHPVDANGVVETFRSLPLHLQKHLGPRVAEKLRQSGHEDAARIVLGVALEGPDVSTEAQIEKSQQLLAGGDSQQAVATLEQLTEEDPEVSAKTLIQLITLKMEQNETVTDDDLTRLQTIYFEQSDPSVRSQIAETEIELHLHRGEFLAALQVLDERQEFFNAAEKQQIHDAIVSDLTARSTDVGFLDLIFKHEVAAADAAIQNQLAERLLELGFLERAETMIEGQTLGQDMSERRYLRAQIAASRNDQETTLAHLAGVQSSRADEIRQMVGVTSIFDANDTSQNAIDAWRKGDWNALSSAEDPVLAEVARRAQVLPENPIEAEAPLTASDELLADSAALRQNIDDLLDRFSVE